MHLFVHDDDSSSAQTRLYLHKGVEVHQDCVTNAPKM